MLTNGFFAFTAMDNQKSAQRTPSKLGQALKIKLVSAAA
jgi:hypothetical protein